MAGPSPARALRFTFLGDASKSVLPQSHEAGQSGSAGSDFAKRFLEQCSRRLEAISGRGAVIGDGGEILRQPIESAQPVVRVGQRQSDKRLFRVARPFG